MTSRREQNRNEQRERILDAARMLFSSQGVDHVTMAQVAERASVSRATVFNYFSSKHALVDAITEDVVAYYIGMLEVALSDTHTATPTLVRALFDQMGMGIEQYHAFYRGVFREIAKVQVGLEEGSAPHQAREAALERLGKLLERGIDRGDLVAAHAPRDLASAFDALVNGTINHWLYEDTEGSLRVRMQRAAEIFLGGVARDSAAGRTDSLPDLMPAQTAPTGLQLRPSAAVSDAREAEVSGGE